MTERNDRLAELRFETPLSLARGIGPARARELAAAGITTVGQLLCHLPHRWEDRRRVLTVRELAAPGAVALRGRLHDLKAVRVRRRGLSLVRGRFEDATGSLGVVWFNRPYLPGWVDGGGEYLLYGEVKAVSRERFELINPSCERAEEAVHGARVVPVYPKLGALGPALLRRIFAGLLPRVDFSSVPEPLPSDLLRRRDLPTLGEALARLHAPGEEVDFEALNERRDPGLVRLIFGELLELQLALARLREREIGALKGHAYRLDEQVRKAAREVLPFRLTQAQRRAAKEIVDDLLAPRPMLRLLQGDVGSGKTVVAALAIVVAVESGLQAAFMAPTELLAEQQFRTLERLLGRRYRVALLTGSADRSGAAEAAREALARGEIQVAVGTHALIEERVRFARLGLAVIDEQHRFGVVQRQLLEQKGDRPDLLVMTATPIPRSLALTVYGDLAPSVIDELPPGRLPIATRVVPAAKRREVYREVRAGLDLGERAYVVFPLIAESDLVEAEALTSLGEKVRAFLAPHAAALLHGQVPPAEREAALAAFARGDVSVLLATTVIEVGIDVPEATWMVIESAERFGLSQLHQLRGRVGRGSAASRCVALHGKLSAQARRRLDVFAGTTDGFAIAEADLDLRGPGDLLGTRQAGLPRLAVADLGADRSWLEAAREEAAHLVARWQDPDLAALRCRLEPGEPDWQGPFGGG